MLYPTHDNYVQAVRKNVGELVSARFINTRRRREADRGSGQGERRRAAALSQKVLLADGCLHWRSCSGVSRSIKTSNFDDGHLVVHALPASLQDTFRMSTKNKYSGEPINPTPGFSATRCPTRPGASNTSTSRGHKKKKKNVLLSRSSPRASRSRSPTRRCRCSVRKASARTRRWRVRGRTCGHCGWPTGRTPCIAGRWRGTELRKYTQEKV